jgi:hypothetical protein
MEQPLRTDDLLDRLSIVTGQSTTLPWIEHRRSPIGFLATSPAIFISYAPYAGPAPDRSRSGAESVEVSSARKRREYAIARIPIQIGPATIQ